MTATAVTHDKARLERVRSGLLGLGYRGRSRIGLRGRLCSRLRCSLGVRRRRGLRAERRRLRGLCANCLRPRACQQQRDACRSLQLARIHITSQNRRFSSRRMSLC